MKLIAGLGNPGKKFKDTRHNIGFMVIDELLRRNNWKLNKTKFNGKYAMEALNGEKVILLEPQTYMNLSGESIRPLMDYYDLGIEDVLVIYDDLDLSAGKIRLRQKGGHGGHNGVKSTINHLGTKEFKRIRLGIDKPEPPVTVINYVLGTFSKEQQTAVQEGVEKAADACEAWMNASFSEVMNEYNI